MTTLDFQSNEVCSSRNNDKQSLCRSSYFEYAKNALQGTFNIHQNAGQNMFRKLNCIQQLHNVIHWYLEISHENISNHVSSTGNILKFNKNLSILMWRLCLHLHCFFISVYVCTRSCFLFTSCESMRFVMCHCTSLFQFYFTIYFKLLSITAYIHSVYQYNLQMFTINKYI